jgi:hypothetical protein
MILLLLLRIIIIIVIITTYGTTHRDNVYVKCTPVQAPRLCTGCMAHRRSTGIALPFHDQGTRRG